MSELNKIFLFYKFHDRSVLTCIGSSALVPTVYPKKTRVLFCHQFPGCVCGSANSEQEDRRTESSEQTEETAAASSSSSE